MTNKEKRRRTSGFLSLVLQQVLFKTSKELNKINQL